MREPIIDPFPGGVNPAIIAPRMRTLSLLLALLAFQQKPPDASKVPQQPIRDWKYTRKDPNPRTGAEEVSLILEGKEAVPVDLTPGKEIFDIRGIHARYFTDPRSPGEKSREIDVRAQRGRLDNRARTLKLDDQVVVFKKGDPALNEIDTVLRTVSALLTFTRKYECPDCRIPRNEPGRCALHDKPLKETSVTNVEADREFEIAGSEGILSGEGLVTDDALHKAYHITKNGFIEFAGAPPSLNGEARAAAPAELKFTQIFSRGPLQITDDEDHRKVKGRGGMRIDRIDSTGTITTEADEMTLATIRPIDPVTKQRRTTEIQDVEARGRVKVEGVVFADGSSFAARADRLNRKHEIVGDAETDLITLLPSPSEPVDLKAGASTISARKVILDRIAGTANFEDVERSDLVSGAQHFSLACRTLLAESGEKTPGSLALKTFKARDQVRLGGLMGASEGPPGRAEADAFDWDAVTGRGLLEGKPTVRIVQGSSLITAPRIVLESPKIMVLKGPKQIHFVQEKDGKREEYRATCDSDLVLDQSTRRLQMQGNCAIRTSEMSLTADRVDGLLSADGRGLESMKARGRVRALRTADHTTLYGDRLTFRFADQDLRVYGDPVAVADTGRSVATQAEIRVYEKINPKTGKKVRFTEMIGVGDGVRIEVDERRPKNGESKP